MLIHSEKEVRLVPFWEHLCDSWKRLHFSQMTEESFFVVYPVNPSRPYIYYSGGEKKDN